MEIDLSVSVIEAGRRLGFSRMALISHTGQLDTE